MVLLFPCPSLQRQSILVPIQAKGGLVIPLFVVVWLSIWGVIAFPLIRKFQWRPFQPIVPEKKLLLLLPLYLLAPFVVWSAIILSQQSWSQIGVPLSPKSLYTLVYGIGIAIGGLSLTFAIKCGFQLVKLQQSEDTALSPPTQNIQTPKIFVLLGLLALGLWIGGIEELIFRGWIQTQLEESFSRWLAASIGSALFATAHLMWDGRSGLWQQPGLWVLGWVLVIARWADGGNLSLAWGLHAGWVGGLAYIDMFLKPQPAEQMPLWLVGRPNQPLTGGLDFLLMVVTAGLVWWMTGKLG